jgi:hypothetical protein
MRRRRAALANQQSFLPTSLTSQHPPPPGPKAIFDFAPFLYVALFTTGGLPAARHDLAAFYAVEAARRVGVDFLLPFAARRAALWRRAAGGAELQRGEAADPRSHTEACKSGSAEAVWAASVSAGGAPAGGWPVKEPPRQQLRRRRVDAAAGDRATPAVAAEISPGQPPNAAPPAGGDGPRATSLTAGQREAWERQALTDLTRLPFSEDASEDTAALVRDVGFVLVFASAFPAGLLLCCALTALRLRLFAARLVRGCRRPAPRRAGGLGRSWRGVMTAQVRARLYVLVGNKVAVPEGSLLRIWLA